MRSTLRRRSPLPLAVTLTFAMGVLVAAGVLTMLLSALLNPLDCIDPDRCVALPGTDFLPQWTGEMRSAWELQEVAFRRLAGVGSALSFVLLGVVAVNVGTRLGTRSLERRREMAMRLALGATPGRLLRPLIGELSGIVTVAALAGGLAGVGVTAFLRRSWPLGAAPWSAAAGRPLWIALGMIALLCVVAAASGLWSALVAWRRDLRRHLNTGDRATPPPSEGLLREGFLILQVAGALVLSVSGALLVTAFHATSDGEPGAGTPDGSISVARLELVGSPSANARGAALHGLIERIRAVPGVTDTSLTNDGAALGLGPADRVTAICPQCGIGALPKQQTSASAHVRAVTPDFFRMMGLGVQRGRGFEDADGIGAPRVAVVSRAFAVRFFPGGDPVGQELRLGELPGEWYRVVGVVDDLPGQGLGSSANWDPVLYLSDLQLPATFRRSDPRGRVRRRQDSKRGGSDAGPGSGRIAQSDSPRCGPAIQRQDPARDLLVGDHPRILDRQRRVAGVDLPLHLRVHRLSIRGESPSSLKARACRRVTTSDPPAASLSERDPRPPRRDVVVSLLSPSIPPHRSPPA